MNPLGTVTLLKQGDLVIAPLNSELDDIQAREFQDSLLKKVSDEDLSSVIIDISALDSMDLFLARIIVETAQMAQLMDAVTVLVGMKPAVAVTLTEMGVVMKGVRMATTLDIAMELLGKTAAHG
ncbi:MAG: STAS domain-containing protein [Candidatus Melainabacteria bacterium]|nr:STAS domain-containing protein [Candidatus Melainabacteria bacterium]